MAAKTAASKIDWSKISSSLGLKRETIASIGQFRKRADDARLKVSSLKESQSSIDFEHYRSVLKNKAVVDQAEKTLKDFKPVTYDVSAQIKAIEAFEGKAVEKAQATASKVDAELQDLQKTLTNIEQSRPLEDLTINDILTARPEIKDHVDNMVKKGKWTVPGYKEKFGDLNLF